MRARTHTYAFALVCVYIRVKRTLRKERGREKEKETASAARRGKSTGGGAFHKSIPTLNPACVPAVHDTRNVSPTDPNPMYDIAAARTGPTYVVAAVARA